MGKIWHYSLNLANAGMHILLLFVLVGKKCASCRQRNRNRAIKVLCRKSCAGRLSAWVTRLYTLE
jgi:hypothetical protein